MPNLLPNDETALSLVSRDALAAWTNFELAEVYRWQLDPVQLENRSVHLFFKGSDEAGRYIMIDAAGSVKVGEYVDAFDGITAAEFSLKGKREFGDVMSALRFVMESASNDFLIEILRRSGLLLCCMRTVATTLDPAGSAVDGTSTQCAQCLQFIVKTKGAWRVQ
jgi:hypothetical protein